MSCYNRDQIILILSKILKNHGSLPTSITNKNNPTESLENDLRGRHFYELSKEKRDIIYGDITIFNPEAFRFYLPEMIYDSLNRNELPALFPIFLLGLSEGSMTVDNRLDYLSKEERKLVLEFLKCILDYANSSSETDAKILSEDYLEDIYKIIDFWKTVSAQ